MHVSAVDPSISGHACPKNIPWRIPQMMGDGGRAPRRFVSLALNINAKHPSPDSVRNSMLMTGFRTSSFLGSRFSRLPPRMVGHQRGTRNTNRVRLTRSPHARRRMKVEDFQLHQRFCLSMLGCEIPDVMVIMHSSYDLTRRPLACVPLLLSILAAWDGTLSGILPPVVSCDCVIDCRVPQHRG
jgi:hypothetical protein